MQPVLQRTAEYLRRHDLGEVVADRAFLPDSCPLALRTEGALAWFRATAADRVDADWRTAQTEIAALPLDRMPFRRLYLTLLVEDCDRPRPDWGRIARDLHVCRKLVVSAAGHPVAAWLGELPFLPIPDDLTRPRLISTPAHALHEAGFAPDLADGLLGNTPAARLAQLFAAGEGLIGAGAPAPAELFLSARDSYRRLVKLDVDNFRPFGRPLSLPLDGDLTVIFGPNGSGKSSLAQALEWGVIGEVATLEQPHDDARAAGGAPPYINVCHPQRPATVRLTLRDEADGAEHALERRIDPTGSRTAVWQGNRATGAGEALTALLDVRLPVMPHIATLKAMARQSHFLDQETIRNFLSDTAADRYKALANMVGTVDFERAAQKLAQVLKTLDGERAGAEGRQKTLLAQLDVESRSLAAQRAELERAGRSVSEALDLTQTAADLHRTAVALGVPVRSEPPSPANDDLTAFAQALHAGVTAEQARLVRRRAQLAAALAEQKRAEQAAEEAERFLAELHELEPAVTERRVDLQRRQAQTEALRHKLESAAAACRQAERDVRAARSRLDAVQALAEAGRAWVQLEEAEVAAGEELKAAETARLEARDRAEAALTSCAQLEAHQDWLRSRRAALAELAAGQPGLAEAQATLDRSAEARTRLLGELAQLQAERQELLRQAGEAESSAAGQESGLKRLQAQSRERHRLLAAMAGYLDGACCPLCGHDWQTAEALLQEVQSALRETPSDLVLAEQALAREAQRLSESRAALARVESRLAGLGTVLDETDQQARQARDRLDR
ncbi:MAG TPA: AAA family ATPase [Symbiobacteriaceae bacterium]|jgi:DNA repair exonuclease SbcCD ATPase subunit